MIIEYLMIIHSKKLLITMWSAKESLVYISGKNKN